jgi:hypothetical protein
MATKKIRKKPKCLSGLLIDQHHHHLLSYLPFNSKTADNPRKYICDQQADFKFISCKNHRCPKLYQAASDHRKGQT